MEYRKIGNSEMELSVVTFGAWAAGGWMWGGCRAKQMPLKQFRLLMIWELLQSTQHRLTDRATSEEIVGEAIKNIPRDKVQILTKYGLRWDT